MTELKLIKCQKCRNPIGKLAVGSSAEFFCWRCRLKTFASLPEAKAA